MTLRRRWIFLVLLMLAASPLFAQTQTCATNGCVSATVARSDENDLTSWKYTFILKEVKKDEYVTIFLQVPEQASFARFEGTPLTPGKAEGFYTWAFKASADNPTVTFALAGTKSEIASGSISWKATRGSTEIVRETATTMDGPTVAFDPGFFNVLIGAGTLITSRGAVNYEVLNNNNVLSATSLGRSKADLIVGGAFNLGFPRIGFGEPNPWSAFVSLRFSPDGANDAIDGFVFGMGYRISKYLDLVAGLALTAREVPSIGFRHAAYLAALKDREKYEQFIPEDLNLNRGQQPFDGFPLLTSQGQPLYSGNPLVTHYRTGAWLGVAFPLRLRTAFGGQ